MKLFGIGLNIAGRGEYPVPTLLKTGLWSARFPLYPDVDIKRYIQELVANQITPIGVVARESVEPFRNWTAAFQHYAALYGDIPEMFWQIGNEPDHQSDSSWTLNGSDVNRLFMTAYNVVGEKNYLGPGLVSGQPQWIEEQGLDLRPYRAAAIHPYAKEPYALNTAAMIRDYRQRTNAVGIGLVATEFHARTLGMALYLREALDGATAFCYTDGMVPGFGICEWRPAWDSFIQASGGARSMALPEPEPVKAPEFVLGFKEWHDLEPDTIGEPLEDEYGPWTGTSAQRTSTGWLNWAEPDRFWFIGDDGTRRRWRPGMPTSEAVSYADRPA